MIFFDLGWVLAIVAVILVCLAIVAAVVVVPFMWREDGCLNRRRERRL